MSFRSFVKLIGKPNSIIHAREGGSKQEKIKMPRPPLLQWPEAGVFLRQAALRLSDNVKKFAVSGRLARRNGAGTKGKEVHRGYAARLFRADSWRFQPLGAGRDSQLNRVRHASSKARRGPRKTRGAAVERATGSRVAPDQVGRSTGDRALLALSPRSHRAQQCFFQSMGSPRISTTDAMSSTRRQLQAGGHAIGRRPPFFKVNSEPSPADRKSR